MFTVNYMSTKVHDDREINNHEVREIKFALTKVGVTRSGKYRGWESGSRDGTVQDARGENSGCVVRKKKGENGGLICNDGDDKWAQRGVAAAVGPSSLSLVARTFPRTLRAIAEWSHPCGTGARHAALLETEGPQDRYLEFCVLGEVVVSLGDLVAREPSPCWLSRASGAPGAR